ncbi:hypothetical protein Lmor_2875 [Legionella moravica]|uniref:Transmembrane protein n=1 Tax=Legionella moravica TaxID=39962 RepID=A0ABR5R812_9GAMM|nr:hypothetical protein Lmor_2875 [Legionella moravica]
MRTVTNSFIGTEGRTRTDTMSPSPDFESGASTNSATPARAVIITKIKILTMDFTKLFVWNSIYLHFLAITGFCMNFMFKKSLILNLWS